MLVPEARRMRHARARAWAQLVAGTWRLTATQSTGVLSLQDAPAARAWQPRDSRRDLGAGCLRVLQLCQGKGTGASAHM